MLGLFRRTDRGPTERGVYACQPQCGYLFVNLGRGRWHGPFVALTSNQVASGDEMTWEELTWFYPDCSRNVTRRRKRR
jgi:hypothetical protein